MRDVNVVIARRSVAALALSATIMACGRSENSTTDSAADNVAAAAATVDTGLSNAATPMAGGTAQITPADAKSVSDASEYKLTETNFRQFIAASDSLVALRRRDAAVRAMFDKEVNDAGITTDVQTRDAGLKRLEENPAISNVIESTGMSVRDYFVASIAIAQAERFMGNPKAAPPTAALPGNAEFLQQHQAELSRLRALERGSTPVSASPGTASPAPSPASTPRE